MRKIINRKLYDTETATELHSTGYGYAGDFNRWEEILYRTKSNALFIYGEGGARSQYSRSVSQNEWSGGEELRPVTTEEAIDWLEKNDGEDVIIEHFPDAIEEA